MALITVLSAEGFPILLSGLTLSPGPWVCLCMRSFSVTELLLYAWLALVNWVLEYRVEQDVAFSWRKTAIITVRTQGGDTDHGTGRRAARA